MISSPNIFMVYQRHSPDAAAGVPARTVGQRKAWKLDAHSSLTVPITTNLVFRSLCQTGAFRSARAFQHLPAAFFSEDSTRSSLIKAFLLSRWLPDSDELSENYSALQTLPPPNSLLFTHLTSLLNCASHSPRFHPPL